MRRRGYIFALGGLLFIAAVGSTACARGREYELRGQVLAVDVARREITVKHDDIRGFMPGMTMPFKVRDAALVEGRTPGELIRATLVVDDTDAYLKAIEPAGHAPLTETPPAPPPAEPLNPGNLVPDAAFVDQSGRTRRLAGWRGQLLGVTFIYTRCPLPDFCPRMDRQFAAVQHAIAGDAQLRGRVHLLSVSFDTAFDTPVVLAAHAKRVGADANLWSVVTGAPDEIATFAARFGVSIVRNAGSPVDIVHNLRTAVIDGEGRLVKVFTGSDWAASDLVAELRSAGGVR